MNTQKALDGVDKMGAASSEGVLGKIVNFIINFWNEILSPIFGFMVPTSGIAGGVGGLLELVP
ncbi:hypothetical protein [Corynebacterium aquatimens]|uniref:Uncharacterized protein n=1 Tax=Corynebacterium aquatimens TaxID=1190508 RepID=A0A931E2H0_9CORY|nr:hypothetical protein [Corynebacterium aquatimens]MBG6122365.1 hypothetical protein [Corynebacterium aquatimens]WJY65092.1 hypothetical protein CAQUA_01795 [Corynebacterium aquatimens]